jgi:hypothetical protein
MLDIANSFSSNLFFYNQMTKTERRVAEVFAGYYWATVEGIHSISYPSRIIIAKKAKCSVKLVSNFLKKYKNLIFKSVIQPKRVGRAAPNQYLANEYDYCDEFFEILCFLKAKGFTKNWNKIGETWLKYAFEDEELTMNRMGFRFGVMNKKSAHGTRSKVLTSSLMDSPNQNKNVHTENVRALPGLKTGKASERLKIGGLSEFTLNFVDNFCSPLVVRQINNDLEFAREKGIEIGNLNGYIIDSARRNTVRLAREIGQTFPQYRKFSRS